MLAEVVDMEAHRASLGSPGYLGQAQFTASGRPADCHCGEPGSDVIAGSDSDGGASSLCVPSSSSQSDGGVTVPYLMELVRSLLGCGMSPDVAGACATSYFNALRGGSDTGSGAASTQSSVAVSKKQARTRRWEQQMSTMPYVSGQCYLHPVRWGRRNDYLAALGNTPKMVDFLRMLEPGDLNLEVAKSIGLYRMNDSVMPVSPVYHVAVQSDQGRLVGTFYDCIASMLRLYPAVNSRYVCDTAGVDAMPLVGVVGLPTVGRSSEVELLRGTALSADELRDLETLVAAERAVALPVYFPPSVSLVSGDGPLASDYHAVYVVRGKAVVDVAGYRLVLAQPLNFLFCCPRTCVTLVDGTYHDTVSVCRRVLTPWQYDSVRYVWHLGDEQALVVRLPEYPLSSDGLVQEYARVSLSVGEVCALDAFEPTVGVFVGSGELQVAGTVRVLAGQRAVFLDAPVHVAMLPCVALQNTVFRFAGIDMRAARVSALSMLIPRTVMSGSRVVETGWVLRPR